MTWPTISFQAAFGAEPLGTSWSWTELATYLETLTIVSPTRSRLIDTFSAGTFTGTLDNSDRRFDPTHLSGPYVSGGRSQIVPNLPVRCVATYSGTDYAQGQWFRDSGAVTWQQPEWSQATWTGTDGFKLLGRAPTVPLSAAAGAEELSGARVARILDNASWPAATRSLDAGLSRMQATLLDLNPLAELQLVAASEGGECWMSKSGSVTFKERDYRASTTSYTFSDAGGGALEYVDLELADDEDLITNYASIARVGGIAQVAQDTTSQSRYGRTSNSTWERSDLAMSADTDAAGLAQMAVDFYSEAIVRFSRMTVNPTVDDALWPFVLGLQLGDRLTITRTPPGGGSATTRTSFVDGWRHTITPANGGTQGEWMTEVMLADVPAAWATIGTLPAWDSATWGTSKWFY